MRFLSSGSGESFKKVFYIVFVVYQNILVYFSRYLIGFKIKDVVELYDGLVQNIFLVFFENLGLILG